MEQQGETIVIALDTAKAFDKVRHENLLLKMKAFGVDATTLNWTKHFLDQRVIRVVMDGFSSEPQNSVLFFNFLFYFKLDVKQAKMPKI